MVCSIASSMKSLMWTLVLLLLLMYVIGVYLTQMIADTGQINPDIFIKEPMLKYYYGNLPRGVLSLYQAMTGGVDWNDLLQPLEDQITPWMGLVFAAYIAFAVLAMMNVVTGVFVESALATARADRESEVVSQVRRLFQITDRDSSGSISWEEFCFALDDEDMGRFMKTLDIDVESARGLFLLLDTDSSGMIEAEEFTQGCLRLQGVARSIDVCTLMYSNKRITSWWHEKMQSLEISLMCIQEYLDDFHSEDRSGSRSPSPHGLDGVAGTESDSPQRIYSKGSQNTSGASALGSGSFSPKSAPLSPRSAPAAIRASSRESFTSGSSSVRSAGRKDDREEQALLAGVQAAAARRHSLSCGDMDGSPRMVRRKSVAERRLSMEAAMSKETAPTFLATWADLKAEGCKRSSAGNMGPQGVNLGGRRSETPTSQSMPPGMGGSRTT